jgi:hypothetical protein
MLVRGTRPGGIINDPLGVTVPALDAVIAMFEAVFGAAGTGSTFDSAAASSASRPPNSCMLSKAFSSPNTASSSPIVLEVGLPS